MRYSDATAVQRAPPMSEAIAGPVGSGYPLGRAPGRC